MPINSWPRYLTRHEYFPAAVAVIGAVGGVFATLAEAGLGDASPLEDCALCHFLNPNIAGYIGFFMGGSRWVHFLAMVVYAILTSLSPCRNILCISLFSSVVWMGRVALDMRSHDLISLGSILGSMVTESIITLLPLILVGVLQVFFIRVAFKTSGG